jgi:hypothetical protein
VARKQWHQECGATTSRTLRCFIKESGFAEAHRRPEERPQKAGVGDSWFAGLKTAEALQKEFGMRFLGPVKKDQHRRVSNRGDAPHLAWNGAGRARGAGGAQ